MLLSIFSIVLLIGCGSSDTGNLNNPSTTQTITKTAMNTPWSNLKPSPTGTPSEIPLFTLSQQEVGQILLELYETNGGCEMPCWWGIVPGETSWETALELLSPIGEFGEPFIYEKGSVYRIFIDVPEGFEPFPPFSVSLETKDHVVVQRITVVDNTTKSYNDYKLSDYLALLGKPDQVYVEVHFDHVFFSLIYLEKGLILYNQEIKNELLKHTEFFSCPQYSDDWYWNVRNPKTVLMEDLVEAVADPRWPNTFPLEEVSEITPQEFYELYLDPDTTVCMEGQGGIEP